MSDDIATREPGETPASIKPYGLADATSLFSQQTSTMNGLWAIYVAATFAIAGFGISSKAMTWDTALAVTIGFWVFALGHLSLLRQTLRILIIVRNELGEVLQANASVGFPQTLARVVHTNNPVWISTAAHLFIDFCATGALWSRIEWGPKVNDLKAACTDCGASLVSTFC